MANLKLRYVLIAFVSVLSFNQIHAQSLNIPAGHNKNALGAAVSTGFFIDKPAVFFGLSIDYSYVINKKFIILGGFAYDQEHKTETKEGESSVVQTITPSLTFGYAITPKFAVGVGIGTGLWDTDNAGQKLNFTDKGNVTAGLLISYTIYTKGHSSFDIGGGLERGFITPETDITIEFGYAYSF